MLPDVMIDIETLGTASDAAVLSIGMVEFDACTGETGTEVYLVLDVDSQLSAGASVTMGTIQWWITEAAAVFPHLTHDGHVTSPDVAAASVNMFCKRRSRIWAQGPHFDMAIMNGLARRHGMVTDCIEDHWKVRDVRTVTELTGVRPNRVKGQHHNAIQDCRAQVAVVVRAFSKLGMAHTGKMGAMVAGAVKQGVV